MNKIRLFSKIKNITIGSDPEEFLQTLDGKIISAEGKLGGTKDNPRKLTEVGHYVQEDNVMVEYNIPPVTGEDEFVRELGIAKEIIEKDVLEGKYVLVAEPSAELTPKEVFTEQGLLIGCEPDYNSYTGETNPTVDLFLDPLIRYCGGHIHIGTSTKMSDEEKRNLIQFMDVFVGCPSNILDEDERRKKMYGQLGRMRYTSYGVEYRTISNWWLKSEKTKRFIFRQTMAAIDHYNKNKGVLTKKTIDLLVNNKYNIICEIFNFADEMLKTKENERIIT